MSNIKKIESKETIKVKKAKIKFNIICLIIFLLGMTAGAVTILTAISVASKEQPIPPRLIPITELLMLVFVIIMLIIYVAKSNMYKQEIKRLESADLMNFEKKQDIPKTTSHKKNRCTSCGATYTFEEIDQCPYCGH